MSYQVSEPHNLSALTGKASRELAPLGTAQPKNNRRIFLETLGRLIPKVLREMVDELNDTATLIARNIFEASTVVEVVELELRDALRSLAYQISAAPLYEQLKVRRKVAQLFREELPRAINQEDELAEAYISERVWAI